MNQTSRQIADLVGGQLFGSQNIVLTSVASLKNAGPSDLSYAEAKFQADAAQSNAGCVLVSSMTFDENANRAFVVAKNPKLAFANAAAVLLRRTETDPEIHPSAVIDPSATIGAGSRVGAGSVVGRNVKIGAGCVLYPRVVVYPNVEIGNNVIIH